MYTLNIKKDKLKYQLFLTLNLLLAITWKPMKILERLKGDILLDDSYLTWWVVFFKPSNKIFPLIFSIISIGFGWFFKMNCEWSISWYFTLVHLCEINLIWIQFKFLVFFQKLAFLFTQNIAGQFSKSTGEGFLRKRPS